MLACLLVHMCDVTRLTNQNAGRLRLHHASYSFLCNLRRLVSYALICAEQLSYLSCRLPSKFGRARSAKQRETTRLPVMHATHVPFGVSNQRTKYDHFL